MKTTIISLAVVLAISTSTLHRCPTARAQNAGVVPRSVRADAVVVPALARSDVVAIAGYLDEQMYRDFGVTVEVWGIETAYFPDDAYLRRCFETARKADVRLISANNPQETMCFTER